MPEFAKAGLRSGGQRMSKLTITEALAETKTIAKRIEKKQAFINDCLFRINAQRDTHEKDGGSAVLIARERQAIGDLEERKVAIRRAIAEANAKTPVSIGGKTKSVADWIVWRREVAPGYMQHLATMAQRIQQVRQQALTKGQAIAATPETAGYTDFVVNINEADLAKERETLEETLGILDGQLSLKNATVTIEV